ncbi:SP_1767 family glycosyltransferase, partial [Streptococcus agalactiae]|nr:SP_1767 family glycosyltransferase [Streptococcus agalactiae]
LDYISKHTASVARFGDGEIDIIAGNSIPYQVYDSELAKRLKRLLNRQSNEKLVICVSDVFDNLGRYNDFSQQFWRGHLYQYNDLYQKNCQAEWYGSTFISRPYMDLLDKSLSVTYFEQLKALWKNKDILIVEGETSRSGVGNDLFNDANTISRIICPSKDAFSSFYEIKETILEHSRGKLILLMLGPTAKLLAEDLSQLGHQAIDLGHIDSEYEWFKMGAVSKVKLSHKHTAEHNFDEDITLIEDNSYENQIVSKIGTSDRQYALTVTLTDDIWELEHLLQRCPNTDFHIAAPVYCSDRLKQLVGYPNYYLHEAITEEQFEVLLLNSDIYLDINHGEEVWNVVDRCITEGKTIY